VSMGLSIADMTSISCTTSIGFAKMIYIVRSFGDFSSLAEKQIVYVAICFYFADVMPMFESNDDLNALHVHISINVLSKMYSVAYREA
jgi:hypothetical protein